jgi:hypothetical protein
MTREGIKKCVRLLQLTFPNTYKTFVAEDLSMLIEAWDLQFKGANDVEVFSALNKAISNSKFPPSIAEIKEYMLPEETVNEEEVWEIVLEAGRNGLYGSYEEWEGLPEDIKAVTSPSTLREIALADSDDLRFIKRDIMSSWKNKRAKDRQLQISIGFIDRKLIGDGNER